MQNIIRLTAAINKVKPANPAECMEGCKPLIYDRSVGDADIMVFPALSLASPSCGNLFSSQILIEQSAAALSGLQSATAGREGYIIIGVVVGEQSAPISAIAVLSKGRIIGLLPTFDSPAPLCSGEGSSYLIPASTVFACGGLSFCVVSCDLGNLLPRMVEAAETGCELIIVPSYTPAFAGQEEEVTSLIAHLSTSLGVAIAVVNGGVGDTSSPYVYRGFVSIFESGTELAYMQAGYESASCTVDIDADIIKATKKYKKVSPAFCTIQPGGQKPGLYRRVERNPLLPSFNQAGYLSDVFDLQARSLADRVKNIGVSRLVVGVSGGLDSTVALLVCIRAAGYLALPRENILAVTMPGLGTSEQTHLNSGRLIQQLGVSGREISIVRSVERHFEDIGHSGQADVVYENAQARERTQILLDLANAVSGIVVGTGDLSEEALGFCTFGGDHLASYNINVCLGKTVLRELAWQLARDGEFGDILDIVKGILETPVSPELLPTQEGEIAQKTEEIIGPYELHDFFLYYFVRYNMRPAKILHYAREAFSDMNPSFIREMLVMFIKRFSAAQFKRSCTPDSASITTVNLSGVNYTIPSDLDPAFLLRDL